MAKLVGRSFCWRWIGKGWWKVPMLREFRAGQGYGVNAAAD